MTADIKEGGSTELTLAPSFDPLNLRDVLAAVGLTRIVSEMSAARTVWCRRSAVLRFAVVGAPEDLPNLCATWTRDHGAAFGYAGRQNVRDVPPEAWREATRGAGGLQAALWAAVGSDGVPHEAGGSQDWSRIAASRLEYAQGAGHVHWLESMARFLGVGSSPEMRPAHLSTESFGRVLEGADLSSLGESDRKVLSSGARPGLAGLAQCRWDPACDRSHALRHTAPAKDKLLQNQTANALAAIGLASCPSAPTKRGLATPLVVRGTGRDVQLAWPIWTDPLRIEALDAALAFGPDAWDGWPIVRSSRSYADKALVFARGEITSQDHAQVGA